MKKEDAMNLSLRDIYECVMGELFLAESYEDKSGQMRASLYVSFAENLINHFERLTQKEIEKAQFIYLFMTANKETKSTVKYLLKQYGEEKDERSKTDTKRT